MFSTQGFKKVGVSVGFVSLLGIFSALAEEIEVPHLFSPNTPAKAEEVNANFSYVTGQLAQLLGRFEESSAQKRVFSKQINCTDDANALRDALAESTTFEAVSIVIMGGACYGALPMYRQGQVVSIHGGVVEKANWPRIIPNPDSDMVTLLADHRSLLLSRLHIELGQNDSYGVYFADNQRGRLRQVTITGLGKATAVMAREGATVFLNDVEIVNVETGITGINSANFLTFGGATVLRDVSDIGINLNFSTMQQAGHIEIDAGKFAVMSNSSGWNVWQHALTTIGTGEVHLNRGSTLTAYEFSNESHINIDRSTLIVRQPTSIHAMSAGRGSMVELNGGSAGGNIRISRNSLADLNNFSVTDVDVVDQSSLVLNNSHINGRLHLSYATAQLDEESTVNFAELRCNGLSHLSIHHVNLLRDHPDTGCLTRSDTDRFHELFRALIIED